MVIADFLGWSSQNWTDTIGLGATFFVIFPALVQGLIGYAVAQGLAERASNQTLAGKWGKRPDEES